MKVFPITVNIYAEEEQEAQAAQKALGQFVDDLGAMGIPVTGNKIATAIPKWKHPGIVRAKIIEHFRIK
jgi:hypothetical protein